MMLIFSIGYFCAGTSAALLASVKWKSVITFYDSVEVYYSIYGDIAQHIAGSTVIHACDAIAVSHSDIKKSAVVLLYQGLIEPQHADTARLSPSNHMRGSRGYQSLHPPRDKKKQKKKTHQIKHKSES